VKWVEGLFRDRKSPFFCRRSYHKLASKKKLFVSVLCITTKSLSVVAAGAIQHKHLSNGSIRWLLVIPRMCSIRQCAPQCTATSAWRSMFLSFACFHSHSERPCYGHNNIKPSYPIIPIVLIKPLLPILVANFGWYHIREVLYSESWCKTADLCVI